ncbi:MAG TPA: sugar ABC transporter permease [Mobilitalea sp.]|nr:sugar ABC transporter permease [Mobilitalea sp.]
MKHLVRKKKSKMTNMRKREARTGYLFISVWLIGTIFLFLRPLAMSFYYAFNKMSIGITGMEYQFIGFDNFTYKFKEDIHFFGSTFQPAISGFLIDVPVCIIFSLFIAMILNQEFRGRTLSRALFFLPVIITSGIVIQILLSVGLNTDLEKENTMIFQTGDITGFLVNLGLPYFITDFFSKVSDRIFNIVWMSGIQILLFLAGLQSIPRAEYEAATMEGATAWECFWKITWVRVSPITLVVFVYSLIDSFTNVSNPMMKFILEEYTNQGNLGGSTALGLMYSLIVFIIIVITYFFASKQVFYVNEN